MPNALFNFHDFPNLVAMQLVFASQVERVKDAHALIEEALVSQGWVDDQGVMKSLNGDIFIHKTSLIQRLTSGSLDPYYCKLVAMLLNSGWHVVGGSGQVGNTSVPGVIVPVQDAIESCIQVASEGQCYAYRD